MTSGPDMETQRHAAYGWLRRAVPVLLILLAVLVYMQLSSLWLAVALVGMIVWHEYGHVRAARQVGVRTKGIFVIPFVGGVAAMESLGETREAQVHIALGGPVFGLYLCVLGFVGALALETGGLLRDAVALWAFLNLFNLAPIHPLDGGRIAHALAHTIHPFAGLLVSGLGAAISTAFGAFTGHPVFLIIAIFGVLEFLNEKRSYQIYRAVRDDAAARERFGELAENIIRRFEGGALTRRKAVGYLVAYLLLAALYASFWVVATYSTRLETGLGGGLL